jgi:hypothetical protein
MREALNISQQSKWAGAVRFAKAHLSDDKTVAKMGHPDLWLDGTCGVGL